MKQPFPIFLAVILAATCITNLHAQDPKPPAAKPALDLKSKIDPLAQSLIEHKLLVGFSIGIYQDGQIQILNYGESEKGSGKQPTAESIYEIGSITKVFTAILLSDMVRQGELKLDDPVQSHLPKDKVTIPRLGEKQITLADLSTHHSGLPRMPGNFKPASALNPFADYTVEQMYAFLSDYKPVREPGALYEYSNLGAGLLGHVFELKTGKRYEELVLERICKPLGMKDTSIALGESQRNRLAKPYNADLLPHENWDIPTLAGAGALRSNVADMLKFLAANLKESDDPLTQSIRATHKIQHRLPQGGAICLGWHQARDGVTLLHDGMTGGYASFAAVIPRRKLAVVVLANTASFEVAAFGESLIRVAVGMDVKPPKRRQVVEVEAQTLKQYVGTYALAPIVMVTVTLEDGRLMVQLTGQPKLSVYPESKTKFFYRAVDAQITFEADDKGAIHQLVLHQNGFNTPAKKVK